MYYNYDDEEYDSEYDCDCYENDRDDCEAYHEQRWRDYKKKKAHKERAALICCLRFDDRSRADRADKSRHGKNRKADQKQRGKNLTDICK